MMAIEQLYHFIQTGDFTNENRFDKYDRFTDTNDSKKYFYYTKKKLKAIEFGTKNYKRHK
jgi:hypothetical protein